MTRLIVPVLLVAAGLAFAALGIFVGHTDDAPGAALIGFVLFAACVGLALWRLRRKA